MRIVWPCQHVNDPTLVPVSKHAHDQLSLLGGGYETDGLQSKSLQFDVAVVAQVGWQGLTQQVGEVGVVVHKVVWLFLNHTSYM